LTQANASVLNRTIRSRINKSLVIIIDEIGLVSAQLLDACEILVRRYATGNKKDVSWAGKQVIFTGDFAQLPPITSLPSDKTFAFESKSWIVKIKNYYQLPKVVRQSDDRFVEALSKIRMGKFDDEVHALFSSRVDQLDNRASVITIMARRNDVSTYNRLQVSRLPGPDTIYSAVDSAKHELKCDDRSMDELLVPSQLFLRRGCRVMLLKNLDSSLPNGTRGWLLGFATLSEFRSYDPDLSPTLSDRGDQEHKKYPVVAWTPDENRPALVQLMKPAVFETYDAEGNVVFSRYQVREPSILHRFLTHASGPNHTRICNHNS
jgi:PIF1-like helicase